jgi:hypothetical protein
LVTVKISAKCSGFYRQKVNIHCVPRPDPRLFILERKAAISMTSFSVRSKAVSRVARKASAEIATLFEAAAGSKAMTVDVAGRASDQG